MALHCIEGKHENEKNKRWWKFSGGRIDRMFRMRRINQKNASKREGETKRKIEKKKKEYQSYVKLEDLNEIKLRRPTSNGKPECNVNDED